MQALARCAGMRLTSISRGCGLDGMWLCGGIGIGGAEKHGMAA
jgi:hypothetical protein